MAKWMMGVHARYRLFLVAFFLFFSTQFASQAAAQLPDFTNLVEKYSPAVVNISTTRKVDPTEMLGKHFQMPEGGDEMLDELLRRFFDFGVPGGEGGSSPHQFDSSSLGSGFIISPDGYVVTNHHVIEGADEIIVKLSDRREFKAKVIGSDKRSDVALLKIEATDLPVVKTGSSKKIKVGAWVLAIGSPFNFDHSVTKGIISAKGRSLPTDSYVPFIQTDVAINPGNSGGPLFNLDGEVVGVNSQIYSRTGGFMGVSFAIPIELAMDVVAQIKERGYVSRGWLGVYIQELSRELAESYGLAHPEGALVTKIMDSSPAAGTDLRPGDIILEFDGKKVPNSGALPALVGSTEVGKEIILGVWRGGEKVAVKMTLGELPAEEDIAQSGKRSVTAGLILGMKIKDLDDEVRKQLGIEAGGILVESVEDDPARQAGLQSGDVLSMINGQKISGVAQFRELVDALPKGKPIAILVNRDKAARFMTLKIEE